MSEARSNQQVDLGSSSLASVDVTTARNVAAAANVMPSPPMPTRKLNRDSTDIGTIFDIYR